MSARVGVGVVLDVCSIQNLIGVVYVLPVVGRGLNLNVSGFWC